MLPSEHTAEPDRRQTPPGGEEILRSERLQIERKTFLFALKENPRGRFLRITEDVAGRRDTIIVPAPGLEEFRRVLDLMIQESAGSPHSPAVASRQANGP